MLRRREDEDDIVLVAEWRGFKKKQTDVKAKTKNLRTNRTACLIKRNGSLAFSTDRLKLTMMRGFFCRKRC